MATIEVSIGIQASPTQVWVYLANIQGYPRWMKGILSLEMTSEATRGVRTSFREVYRAALGFKAVDEMVCTEWVEGELLVVKHRGSTKGTSSFHLVPIELGTRLRRKEEVHLPIGWPGAIVFRLFFRRALRRTFSNDLRNLKALVEGRRT